MDAKAIFSAGADRPDRRTLATEGKSACPTRPLAFPSNSLRSVRRRENSTSGNFCTTRWVRKTSTYIGAAMTSFPEGLRI
jgi:hypothetical protein